MIRLIFRSIHIGLILFCFNPDAFGQNTIEWVFTNSGKETQSNSVLAVDELENVYITGTFEEVVDFDPGAGDMSVADFPSRPDMFLQKVNSNGELIWIKTFTGWGDAEPADITIDKNGNLYILGALNGETDFDPGDAVFNVESENVNDGFVLKLTSDGEFLWVKMFNGYDNMSTYSICVAHDFIYTVGAFKGTFDFDPGEDVYDLSAVDHFDPFIHKMTIDGDFIWAKTYGDEVHCFDIDVDREKNVYVVGGFRGLVDFNLAADEVSELNCDNILDVYVLKLDEFGDFLWAKSMPGDGNDAAKAVLVDNTDEIFISGNFFDDIDFDMGDGEEIVESLGNWDGFIEKIDGEGNMIWVYPYGGTGKQYSEDLATDNQGNVYTVGSYNGGFDIDIGPEEYFLGATGPSNVYYLALDGDLGTFNWAARIAGVCNASDSWSIDISDNNQIYSTGYFDGYMEFDEEHGISPIYGIDDKEIFVLKFGSNVSINEIPMDAFEIYPTVVEDYISINTETIYTFDLLSLNGQTILHGSGNGNKQISLAHLGSGVYLLRLVAGEQSTTVKIVKN